MGSVDTHFGRAASSREANRKSKMLSIFVAVVEKRGAVHPKVNMAIVIIPYLFSYKKGFSPL